MTWFSAILYNRKSTNNQNCEFSALILTTPVRALWDDNGGQRPLVVSMQTFAENTTVHNFKEYYSATICTSDKDRQKFSTNAYSKLPLYRKLFH